jgi:hypothetical protein
VQNLRNGINHGPALLRLQLANYMISDALLTPHEAFCPKRDSVASSQLIMQKF